MSQRESELANDKALMEVNQHQELLEAGLDAELTRQAKLVIHSTASFVISFGHC